LSSKLKILGIQTNKFNNEWTGISAERYRKFIKLLSLSQSNSQNISFETNNRRKVRYFLSELVPFIAFLWSKFHSRSSIKEYFTNLNLFSEKNLLKSIPPEWDSDVFNDADLSRKNVIAAWNEVFSSKYDLGSHDKPLQSSKEYESDSMFSRAFELLTASAATEYTIKIPIKLGRYCYDLNNETENNNHKLWRPDCVEVVVREIIDSLLFGKNQITSLCSIYHLVILSFCLSSRCIESEFQPRFTSTNLLSGTKIVLSSLYNERIR
jgi:hypothetical protein